MIKQYNVTVNGVAYEVTVEALSGGRATPLPVNRAAAAAPVYAPAPVAAPAPAPVAAPAPAPAPVAAPAPAPAAAPAGGESITSPMPGTILDVKVAAGQAVKKGDILMILEAMKMENEIMCPRDGVVASVAVTKGATVDSGTLLCVVG